MQKYTAAMLFRDFRDAYPELWRRGCFYELCGYMQIRIHIPHTGKVIYDFFGDKLTWLERWEDPNETKRKERIYRSDTYDRFVNEVGARMLELDLSQQDIADMTGISRKSINQYLGGRAIPKLSTMQHICKTLNIDI